MILYGLMIIEMKDNKLGFTLVEVIFAIIILSSSLVVLLGLMSSSVSKSLRDRNQLYAMLIARNILSALEMEETINDQNTTDTAYQLLKSLNGFAREEPDERELYNGMDAELIVEDWETPAELMDQLQSTNTILKKIYLRVFWGVTQDDELEVVYFVPNK